MATYVLYSSVNHVQTDVVSVNDRALAYGDGVFTTAKIYNGKLIMLDQHINRLRASCEILSILCVDYVAIKKEIINVAAQFEEAVLKVIISSGQGGKGYSRKGCSKPTVFVKVSEFPTHYDDWRQSGINLGVSINKLGINPLLSAVKHLNRLEQVFIRAELDQSTFDDLLVLNINNEVIETSCANVFWFHNDQLYTPVIEDSGVAGLMRQEIINSMKVTIVKAKLTEIAQCRAMFICNSVMGIVPVNTFGQRKLPIEPVLGLNNMSFN